jgi:putative transposase
MCVRDEGETRRGRACPARNVQRMQNPIVLPHRKQLRLRGYDYAFPGVYFVTICSAGKRPVFASTSGESIVLSLAGEIVRSEWIALPERFARLVLDEFVIMPNHLHGVLAFVGHAGGASPGSMGGQAPPLRRGTPQRNREGQAPPLQCLM